MWRPKKDPYRSSWNDDVSQDVTDAEGDIIGDVDTVESYYDKRKRRMVGSQPRAADPKIEAAVIAEVVERLRQAGIKMIGEDPMEATRMFDQIKDAMKGEDPSKWTKGWEQDEPNWKINPKVEYSPAYDRLPDPLKALSDEYTQILSKYGLTKRKLTTKTAANVREDLVDEGIANRYSHGEATERGTGREVLNISVEDRKRLSEIVLQFAKRNGYFTDLAHASRSKSLEGPMKGTYSDMGVALHAGIKGEPYSIGGFGEYRYPMKARGEFFDYTNDTHMAKLETEIQKLVDAGNWIKAGRDGNARLYKMETAVGTIANIRDGRGQFHRWERIGMNANLKTALEKAGFTGYREMEAGQGMGSDDPLPHVAITKSNNVKMSDLVTFGPDGSVIPIHERFNVNNADPRYSPVDRIDDAQVTAYRAAGRDYVTNSVGGSSAFRYKMLPPEMKPLADEYMGITRGDKWKDHLSPEWKRLGEITQAFSERMGYTQKGEETETSGQTSVNPAVQGEGGTKSVNPVTYDSNGTLIPIFERFNRVSKNPNYSPVNRNTPEGFVPYERLFDEENATGSLYSKNAKAKLGDYELDFVQIKDQELKEGMDDAPMGANKLPDTTNPMSIIRLTKKGAKDSSVEFYLMVNRESEAGRPQIMSRMAVLQMSRKKGDITVEPLVGVLSEVVERLKMTGITQLMVPKKPWPEMAFQLRKNLEKAKSEAIAEGIDYEGPEVSTIVDEHDALRIVMKDNMFGQEVKMEAGPTLMYSIKRNEQYSPTDKNARSKNSVTGEPNQALVRAALRASEEKKKGKGNGN
jgi:hypothetical protein